MSTKRKAEEDPAALKKNKKTEEEVDAEEEEQVEEEEDLGEEEEVVDEEDEEDLGNLILLYPGYPTARVAVLVCALFLSLLAPFRLSFGYCFLTQAVVKLSCKGKIWAEFSTLEVPVLA
jgi:hypothetical protein